MAISYRALIAEAKRDRTRYAFLSKRVGATVASRLSKKGREIKLAGLPTEMRKQWLKGSGYEEWKKWTQHASVYLPGRDDIST